MHLCSRLSWHRSPEQRFLLLFLQLPNVDPETGIADKAVPYKVIMKFRARLDPLQKMKPCVGSYAVPDAAGVVSVGDVVFVRKMIGE